MTILIFTTDGINSKMVFNLAAGTGHIAASIFAFLIVERGNKLQEQIVIGTPGTVLDWCTKYKLIDPKKINMFVLDEADVMIATQGHRDQSIRIHR